MEDKFITLVIHTYDRAVSLRKILESHGIEVKFENLVISGAHIASGVRVKINERNLPLALKITESGEGYSAAKVEMKMAGTSGNLLIPIDFSDYSMLACRMGFELAKRLSLHPLIMNTYVTPYFGGNLAYSDGLDGTGPTGVDDGIAEMEADRSLREDSESRMREFSAKIKKAQGEGTLPNIKFTTMVSEGVPEDVIGEYCRLTPPALIVMATRGESKKKEDLVGSVTAEVLDSCRVPVLAIPENFRFESVEAIDKLLFFCNLDQHDILSVDTLMRMFDYPEVEVTLIPVNERAGKNIREKVESLCDYFNSNYPTARFGYRIFPVKTFRQEFEAFVGESGAELMIVPNKKKNIFSRLFNPGIAHKLLFERDLPLLALPV
ncbi:MAG: universal stress protein [Bacteroides sp.]|nr:universal stress protein [Bacteroides sp.]